MLESDRKREAPILTKKHGVRSPEQRDIFFTPFAIGHVAHDYRFYRARDKDTSAAFTERVHGHR